MTREHCLYRFFDEVGQLLYVGITWSLPHRMKEHRQEKAWWDDVASMTVERFETRQEARKAERRAIRLEEPAHNIMGVALRSSWDRLVEMEPRLVELEGFLARFHDPEMWGDYCGERLWFGERHETDWWWPATFPGVKAALSGLVGWNRPGGEDTPVGQILRSQDSYDLAYETLRHTLPDCGRWCASCRGVA